MKKGKKNRMQTTYRFYWVQSENSTDSPFEEHVYYTHTPENEQMLGLNGCEDLVMKVVGSNW
jgi:hypothetical protein